VIFFCLPLYYKSNLTIKPPYVVPYPVAPTGTWMSVAATLLNTPPPRLGAVVARQLIVARLVH